jgi:riboflavin synthase
MFTGLVERVGTVRESRATPSGRRLVVHAGAWPGDPVTGESISVSGCCLTLVAHTADGLHFDVIPQTLACTTLGDRVAGDPVNLERSVRAQGLLGGHLVQGHVDGAGTVLAVDRDRGWRVRVRPPMSVQSLMVDRGSVAMDGVSLTAAAVGSDWFEVALIPETLERTTLRRLQPGDRVNVEADVLAKMVATQVALRLGQPAPPAPPG